MNDDYDIYDFDDFDDRFDDDDNDFSMFLDEDFIDELQRAFITTEAFNNAFGNNNQPFTIVMSYGHRNDVAPKCPEYSKAECSKSVAGNCWTHRATNGDISYCPVIMGMDENKENRNE